MGGLSASALDLFVATDGDDAWSGRLKTPKPDKSDGPLATFERARDELRKLRTAGGGKAPATVYVRGGTYELSRTFQLGPADSGTAEAPVIYRAVAGEKPVLIGGRRLTGFVSHQGQVLKLDLAAKGLKGVYFRQLLCNGQRQPLARYPNYDPQNPYGGGWAYVDGKIVNMYQDVPGENQHTLVVKSQDARHWQRPEEAEVFVFPRYNWWNNIVRIKGLDPGTRQITLAADASYPIRPGDRYYVQNALEELDAPGEWHLDRQSWTLYFWPPTPTDAPTVYVPTLRTMLEFQAGASFITVRDLTFACCEGTAIAMKNTEHCLVAANKIQCVGDYHGSGVSIDGGSHNAAVGNDIAFTGSHGIAISGGDRKQLVSAENYADNNYIHHVGVYYKQGVGISLHGVGNRASHNLIHDGPRMGIMFSGNNLVLEYNHLRHLNLETEDTGAVYTGGRDWISSRGSVIRYNYFHDMLGYGHENGKWMSPHFAWGVYLDDNTGGVDVIGNIVARCSRAGLHLHNARDSHVENNIFVENGQQQFEYSGWRNTDRMWKDHFPTMVQGYESVANEPAWAALRNMRVHPKDAPLPDGKIMTGNRFLRNIVCYRNPQAKYFQSRQVPFDRNEFDYNLVYHFGQPLVTGQRQAGPELGENLAPNASFESGTLGQLPADWQWQIRPHPEARAELTEGSAADGKRALCIGGASGKDAKGNLSFPILVSREFPAQPGHHYRLKAKLKASQPEAKASLMLQSYVANVYFWANWPNDLKVGTEWRDYEFVFKIPAQGEKGWHEQLRTFRARVDFRETSGDLWVDAVSVREVEMLDEWASWQALGLDRHSLVANPQFVAPEKDDYRLQPDSPAWKLGFQTIPVEKIGPYQDELRATWPIVEAEGAREKPLMAAVSGP